MSWQATNWAVQQKTGSPANKVILLLLADRADEAHSCWPSQERLAEESEQAVATVRRRIRHLEQLGLVTTERRTIPGRQRATNRYVLAVDSTAQIERQNSEGQSAGLPLNSEELPLNSAQNYRSAVSDEQSIEPPTEPPVKNPPSSPAAPAEPWTPFDEFWSAYPRKKDKGHARKAFAKAARATDPAIIVAAAVRYRQWCEQDQIDPQFIPYPATWLNGERWTDERDREQATREQEWLALLAETVDNGPQGYPQQIEGS